MDDDALAAIDARNRGPRTTSPVAGRTSAAFVTAFAKEILIFSRPMEDE